MENLTDGKGSYIFDGRKGISSSLMEHKKLPQINNLGILEEFVLPSSRASTQRSMLSL
jgi:hypothetical protein